MSAIMLPPISTVEFFIQKFADNATINIFKVEEKKI